MSWLLKLEMGFRLTIMFVAVAILAMMATAHGFTGISGIDGAISFTITPPHQLPYVPPCVGHTHPDLNPASPTYGTPVCGK